MTPEQSIEKLKALQTQWVVLGINLGARYFFGDHGGEDDAFIDRFLDGIRRYERAIAVHERRLKER